MNELSPKIVRAWFDTILNPLINGLKIENHLLDKNNLTWRGFNRYFEALKPIHSMFDYRYNANFDQIVLLVYEEFDILKIINNHDNELENLRLICNNLFEKLINSDSLKKLYKNILSEYFKNNPKLDKYFKEDLQEDVNFNYLSEYIINGVNDLDTSYVLSPIWNSNKDTFKNILNEKDFISLNQKLYKSISKFKKSVNNSLQEISRFRNNLSIKYGEPIVLLTE